MAKFISNDLVMYIGVATPTPVDVKDTGGTLNFDGTDPVSVAAPSVLTVDADMTALTPAIKDGDIIEFSDTTVDELDGNLFALDTIATTTANLLGTDIDATEKAAFVAALTATVKASALIYDSEDFTKVCLSAFTVAEPTNTEIDTSTYCEESNLPGPTTLGQITLEGYVDKDTAAYTMLKTMSEDGSERLVKLVGPDSQYWVGKLKIGSLSWDFTRGEVVTFTATASQVKGLKHLF